jgi:hypothetical protein
MSLFSKRGPVVRQQLAHSKQSICSKASSCNSLVKMSKSFGFLALSLSYNFVLIIDGMIALAFQM